MQSLPNRAGLGARPGAYGQGPTLQALAQQQLGAPYAPSPPARPTNLFVGSISAGISDGVLNQLLAACGPIKAFKRLITPANKPQGFGFAEFEDPDGALRAMAVLNGVSLPALEDGAPSKALLVKADEKTGMFLSAYRAQRMNTDHDDALLAQAQAAVAQIVSDITRGAAASGAQRPEGERLVIPPHLHDLHEAELPEAQRGLVISEIAMFRERAAVRERDKARETRPAPALAPVQAQAPRPQREWGRPQGTGAAVGGGPQGYDRPPGFVRAETAASPTSTQTPATPAPVQHKTDEELEAERKEQRRLTEEASFRDRERRYEPRERPRLAALERAAMRERAVGEAQARDREEMRARLAVWDDDESDELFYTDRARWRHLRARRVQAEEAADRDSRAYEAREAENLRRESEAFLARQMEDMQALHDEQRRAGMLLDDGAPVRLAVQLATHAAPAPKETKVVLGAEEDEEDAARKRKAPLVKLEFSAPADAEAERAQLEKVKAMVPRERDALFKGKVRWDALTDAVIDRKFEPLVSRLMRKYLGELEDDDLVLFVLEHLKDHKAPQKLVDGLEPVLEEDAGELATTVWRQVIFESMAYGEGLHTERMMLD